MIIGMVFTSPWISSHCLQFEKSQLSLPSRMALKLPWVSALLRHRNRLISFTICHISFELGRRFLVFNVFVRAALSALYNGRFQSHWFGLLIVCIQKSLLSLPLSLSLHSGGFSLFRGNYVCIILVSSFLGHEGYVSVVPIAVQGSTPATTDHWAMQLSQRCSPIKLFCSFTRLKIPEAICTFLFLRRRLVSHVALALELMPQCFPAHPFQHSAGAGQTSLVHLLAPRLMCADHQCAQFIEALLGMWGTADLSHVEMLIPFQNFLSTRLGGPGRALMRPQLHNGARNHISIFIIGVWGYVFESRKK